jgi:hypothetical protein
VFRSTSFRILFLVRIQLCALHPFWCPFSPSASEIFRAATPLSLQNLDEFAGGKGRRMKKIDNFIKEREKTLLFLGEDRNTFWLVRCTTKARKERSFANQHQRIRHAVMAKAYLQPQPLSFFVCEQVALGLASHNLRALTWRAIFFDSFRRDRRSNSKRTGGGSELSQRIQHECKLLSRSIIDATTIFLFFKRVQEVFCRLFRCC